MAIGTRSAQVDEVSKRELNEYLRTFSERQFPEVKTAFQKHAMEAHATVQDNARSKLHHRTGTLARSIKFNVSGANIDSLEASIYTAANVGGAEVVYAPIHEYGGTISAKRAYRKVPGGPYLNIPLPKNLTAAGVQRMTPKMVFDRGGTLIPKNSGFGYNVLLPGVGLMFTLVKKVTIPPRLGMRDAVEEQIPLLIESLRQVLDGK